MEDCQLDNYDNGVMKTLSTSVVKELLEEVEQPAWTSLSLSESCASQISSWCSETKSSYHDYINEGTRSVVPLYCVPQNHEVSSQAAVSSSSLIEGLVNDDQETLSGHSTPVLEGLKNTSLCLESLQSLSSSTQTLHASPKSNSDKFITSIKNMKMLEDKFPFRRGSLSRDRAPSEDAIDFRKSKLCNEFKLSQSLQDVSSIPSDSIQAHKASRNSESLSLLNSKNKSRDSGFIHSDSLLSLNSNGRNYNHVESKVKLYIQNIKDADAVRRKQRNCVTSWASKANLKHNSVEDISVSSENLDLQSTVEKLRNEIVEKDRLLYHLQENYDSLLLKYADAETRIDRLRFSSIGQSSTAQCKHLSKSYSIKLPLLSHGDDGEVSDCHLSNPKLLKICDSFVSDNSIDCSENLTPLSICDGIRSSLSSSTSADSGANCRNGKNAKMGIVISAPLRPVSRLYSTSARLDRILSPLPDNDSRPGSSNITGNVEQKFGSKKKLVTSDRTTNTTGSYPDSRQEGHFQAVDLLPKEDPFLKVQRWQNDNGQYEECGLAKRGFLKYSSSKCDSFTASENEKKDNHSRTKSELNSSHQNKSELSFSKPPINSTSNVCQRCEGKCTHCGSTISVNRVVNQAVTPTNNNMESLQEPHTSSSPFCQDQLCLSKHHRLKHDESSFTSEVDWKSLVSKHELEHDHVVPHSPQNEISVGHLQKSFCSHGKVSNPRNFALLLDIFLKMSCKSCCHFAETTKKSPDHDNQIALESCENSSLLQCLNEVDEYAKQLWMKTKSCLDKLDSN